MSREMRSSLNVFITVDTEIWPKNPDGTRYIGPNLKEHIRRDIYGITERGEYGLPFQMDVLDAHGLKAVFLVESLFACAAGIEPLAEIVAMIQKRGHEVQLHTHSEWLPWMPESILPGRTGQNLKDFTEEEQRVLLARGLDNLRKAGASDVCAFRAGNYGADFATLHALSHHGIRFDTSYNFCYLDQECGLRLPNPLVQPEMVEGVCEVPISFFSDYPGHYRHTQLCACSHREMRQALTQAWKSGWRTFVIVSHSFELLRRNRFGIPDALDQFVIKRFEKLCRFLGENRNAYRTVGFSELDPSSLLGLSPARELRSSMVSTALRCGEQLIGRLRR